MTWPPRQPTPAQVPEQGSDSGAQECSAPSSGSTKDLKA